MVDLTREAIGGSLLGARVAVLGAAFKPDSDDVRDSPALSIAGQIQLQGASVRVYDPKAMDNARRVFPTLDYASDEIEACCGADAVLVLTEWKQFRQLDPSGLTDVVDRPLVIDGRHCLPADEWRAAGWTYRCLGRGPSRAREQTVSAQQHPLVSFELSDP
jgi:UDPglucose 6-dehydrogenase